MKDRYYIHENGEIACGVFARGIPAGWKRIDGRKAKRMAHERGEFILPIHGPEIYTEAERRAMART